MMHPHAKPNDSFTTTMSWRTRAKLKQQLPIKLIATDGVFDGCIIANLPAICDLADNTTLVMD